MRLADDLDLVGRLDSWWTQRKQRARWRRDWPERIILVRHGESLGNTDKVYFSNVPDSQIALTDRGYAQAAVAGMKIRKLIGNETVRFFHSPYMRTRQTQHAILKASFGGQPVQISSEPRLREQDFGNFQDPEAMDAIFAERMSFGRFYYRFPNGEAGTDVFDRTAGFLKYLWATFGARGYHVDARQSGRSPKPVANYVLVTHGLLMRIFCMCYLRWTVTEFEDVWNPSNGEIWVLQKVPATGTYELRGRWRASRATAGRFVDVKFGADRVQKMPAHMKRPSPSRLCVDPGARDAFDGEDLRHLRDLPAPRGWKRGDWGTWTGDQW